MAAKATVLLIDDELPLLDVLGAALDSSGYICLRSSDAAGALRILDRTPEIDVIVSDIRMPGMDGIELLKTVRERFADRGWLQVIFITGHATLENSVEALRLNAVDFLNKPIRRQQLLEAVDRAVEKGGAQRELTFRLNEGHERLTKLMEEAQQLSDVLSAFPGTTRLAPQAAVVPAGPRTTAEKDEPMSRERLLKLLRTRNIKTRYFTDRLFADPAWHMILDLMENQLLERNVSVSSLYLASGVAAATAARRLEEMEEAGLIERWLDPADRRRQFVKLSDKTVEMVTHYLVALDDGLAG